MRSENVDSRKCRDSVLTHRPSTTFTNGEQPPRLRSSPNGRRGDVRALVRLAEEALLDELFEQLLACRDMHVPQTTRLRARQLQSWHFGVFTANTSGDGIKPRCLGVVLKILSIGHEGSLVMSRPSLHVGMVSTMRNRALPSIMRA